MEFHFIECQKTNKESKVACFEFFTCAAAFVLRSKV